MKVQIQRASDNPANTMLEVYTDNTRPLCKIWEEDFAEILSDRQVDMLEAGKHIFNVNRAELNEKSKVWYA